MTLTPRISRDGTRLAVQINGEISVFDIGRGTLTRITFNRAPDGYPVWAPDGRHIVYSGQDGIWWTRADGSSQAERLLENKGNAVPCSFSPDGKRLAFHEAGSCLRVIRSELARSSSESDTMPAIAWDDRAADDCALSDHRQTRRRRHGRGVARDGYEAGSGSRH